ncbi:MAG: FHA domain-containing protein, partial [Chloroflexi bacterium]|nr:FHA domain-containing protein [Chloroflexota bacterium]
MTVTLETADGTSYRVTAELSTIGRSALADLQLDDPSVAEQHARLIRTAEGVFVLPTKAGLRLNGQAISERSALRPGDRLLVGSVELRVHAADVLGRV